MCCHVCADAWKKTWATMTDEEKAAHNRKTNDEMEAWLKRLTLRISDRANNPNREYANKLNCRATPRFAASGWFGVNG